MHATLPRLKETDFPRIVRKSLSTLQVNLGYRCNQTCLHCHVNAGPTRKEQMSHETIGDVLRFLKQQKLQTLDVTGGAPELNPHFRYLVEQAHASGVHIIDRCNLTVLFEPAAGTKAAGPLSYVFEVFAKAGHAGVHNSRVALIRLHEQILP